MKHGCEILYCFEPAMARITVPHHKPKMCVCEEHLQTTLEWAENYRRIPGMVTAEPLSK